MAGRRARHARSRRAVELAQHFLRSETLAAALVRDAHVRRDELVVEIGAGSGQLTRELAKHARFVRAIEVDPVWAERLRARVAAPNVEVVEADALEVPLPSEAFRVVANVPFNRTTAIMHRLLDDVRVPLTRADLIVEWPFACKRAAVWPTTLLGVCWSARYELAVTRRLGAACFEPRPRVDAGVLRVLARENPLVARDADDAFRAFVRLGFTSRAPTVRHALEPVISPLKFKRVADEFGFDRRAAARELDPYQWAALFAASRA